MGTSRDTKWTNNTNLQINREQLDAAKEMQQREMDYQTEMWNKSNSYNAPSAQMDRYREAGLNPYMMMSGQSAVSADPMNAPSGSVPSAIPVENPAHEKIAKTQAISESINNLGQRLDAAADRDLKLAQAEQLRSQTAGINIDNGYKTAMNENALSYGRTQIDNMNAGTRLQNQSYDTNQQVEGYYVELQKQNAKLAESTAINMDLNNLMLSEELDWLPREKAAQLAQLLANNRLTEKQISKVSKEIESISEDISSKRVEGKTLEKRMDALYRSMDAEAQSKEIDNLMKNFSPEDRAMIKFYQVIRQSNEAFNTLPSSSINPFLHLDYSNSLEKAIEQQKNARIRFEKKLQKRH